MNGAIHTEKYKGYTLEIIPDEGYESPRDWDNLGTMAFLPHRHYKLGDEVIQSSSIKGYFGPNKVAALPISVYEHGGIALHAGYDVPYPFNDQWDASQYVGVIYVSRKKVLKEYGWKRITRSRRQKIIGYLKAEVEVYNQFLNGDVYGYNVTSPDGDNLDSVWGFYGTDAAIEAAKESIDWYAADAAKEQAELDSRLESVTL